ncbi:conserved hypothetical protein [Gloeothece citriformis PCC 7424]|uniref:Uncharacterized protein n=1 Tax=Gloeothece citriformis (strain PCC 7424) TaxID=65393 RepID=B7K862_GLOC7|nr:hypothetical protein [Gloeothece citriformis]ACK68550.1 conserved hypothetical protein [Gloeothece citriformis PCC 7424]
MSNPNIEVCPVCGVKIENGDKVIFSVGNPGTRARLYARVCNYVQKSGCINQEQESLGVISANDYYRPI